MRLLSLLQASMLLAASALGVVGASCSRGSHTGSERFERLDSLLNEEPAIESRHRASIDSVRRRYVSASTDSDRYAVSRALYSLYRNYRCDSAMIIAGTRLDLASRIGDPSKKASALLNLAETCLNAGDYTSAMQSLETVDRRNLADYHRKSLYNIYANLYGELAEREVLPARRLQLQDLTALYTDSALVYYTPSDNSYYRLRARLFELRGMTAEAVGQLRTAEKKLSLRPTDKALLGRLLIRTGHDDEALDYLIAASEADVEREVLTADNLINVAILLNKRGDQSRAYRYLGVAMNRASRANALNLEDKVLHAAPLISQAVHDSDSRTVSRQRAAIAAVISLALLLTAALAALAVILRRQRRTSLRLTDANRQLSDTNALLKEADTVKQKYIVELFDTCSQTIDHNIETKRKIARLLRASQTEKALDCVRGGRDEQDALHDLHARFDAIFLGLYPNFVEDFNSLVRPEARLDPGSQWLTPETRVVALMRLGITSSGEIARVLHYSPQTVYNYRSRIRNWLAVSPEEFDSRMRTIGL